jgi:hypothetical protein
MIQTSIEQLLDTLSLEEMNRFQAPAELRLPLAGVTN